MKVVYAPLCRPHFLLNPCSQHNVMYWKLWDVVYSECQPLCQVPGKEVD